MGAMKLETLEMPDNVRREIERLQRCVEAAESERDEARADLTAERSRRRKERHELEAALRELYEAFDDGEQVTAKQYNALANARSLLSEEKG